MLLKKRERSKPSAEPLVDGGKAEGKRSKRQRIADFFKSRKQKAEEKVVTVSKHPSLFPPFTPPSNLTTSPPLFELLHPTTINKIPSHKPSRDSKITASPHQAKSANKVVPLSEGQIRMLFSGAPHFAINSTDTGPQPSVSYPWDEELVVRDVSDSGQLSQPAFSSATLRRHLPLLQQPSDQDKQHLGYDINLVEVPSMLSAQGLERGSIGFVHFLELPASDSLITDLQQSQSTNGFLETVRNKEQMQTNPERLGIRKVNMSHIYDRLAEFGDLIEVFHDSPEHMTILNNQSSGDLYANLFGKFLTPPPYDDATDDPTGMKVQINALLRILGLKGVWYDFSLVEWRIRLGQILWSNRDVTDDDNTDHLWTEREVLLLQLTLACELLFRLDAITSMDVNQVISQIHVNLADYEGFKENKTRKIDWDLVLARRFLDNILVIREDERDASSPAPKSRGLLSIFSSDSAPSSEPDIVFVPRHQVRQLSGLLHFAEAIQWPGIDLIVEELALKLGTSKEVQEPDQLPSPQGKFLDPSTPSSISVYGTPLATPRTPRSVQDSYFGHMARPALNRTETPRSLTVPLSSTLLAHAAEKNANTLNVGGWLSRSLLTGLVLPGEAISHFLMSTLLENDKLAIATLGDAANLYGGLIYSQKTWWSKSSVVGRVLACLDNATECMGWIYVPKLPEDLPDSWYSISSEQVQFELPPRIKAAEDSVTRDSAIVPGGDLTIVKSEDLILPQDPSTPPVPSILFAKWDLKPIGSDLSDNDTSSEPPLEIQLHRASLTFTSPSRGTTHALALTYDVQYITSFPCTSPSASTSNANSPPVLKGSLSRSSSKRSIHSNRISRIPLSRRNSHGFEPLLSHPPDSPSMAPIRTHSPDPDAEVEELTRSPSPKMLPLKSHPLHISYKYQIVPATDILDTNFVLPFSPPLNSFSPPNTPGEEDKDIQIETPTVLILDARASQNLELLSRTWCAQKGFHAIISRVGRTCLSCTIREARGLGVKVVIRVE
ncbi:hypothetical protein B0J11DRAFT_442845 [Dendryphion nanum]|uniref:Uncharacterized protein n=1 Tax=Dendryphion nanum TaxID=256645 RepID=A0A9P9IEH3_9PLEO|nr:hypothetical protein B0J11DRAFT_442845 [Dendryphion nanum]